MLVVCQRCSNGSGLTKLLSRKQNLYFMKIAHNIIVRANKSADQVQEDYNKLAEYQWIIVN